MGLEENLSMEELFKMKTFLGPLIQRGQYGVAGLR